ncbi:MAG: hypothetical protein SGJ27_18385 [Candidatus Melainabacteria bacterium]|nr:hypothetical protein [Candidatus Melainabacteria bacterium]
MELISDGPMETSASSSEGVTLHLSELADMDKYSVIYEIARIQTLISSLSSDNCRSAA